MMPPRTTDSTDAVRDQAAIWFVRMQSGEATQAQTRAFHAWYAADAEHARQYHNLAYFWDAAGQLPAPALHAILAHGTPPSIPFFRRPSFAWSLTATCMALVLVHLSNVRWLSDSADFTREVHTERGQRKDIALPDGSTLVLNTDTHAIVKFYARQRVVELVRGEVMLRVARDKERPLTVNTDFGKVVVTGTRFNVWRDPSTLQVAVESGSVNVIAGSWWQQKTRTLTAGMGVSLNQTADFSVLPDSEIERVAAWQQGKIIVKNMPLPQVIREINRYLPTPATLDAPNLQHYRVAGIFDANNPQSMLDALPAIAPVQVVQFTDGRWRITAK